MPDNKGYYYFNNGLSCLFEMPTSDARRLLPSCLQPLEIQHERSVLSVTAFDFFEGDGGVYQELVLSILVPPLVKPGDILPKAALYPFSVATSTEFGRKEGIERWRLPHFMRDIDVEFVEGESELSVSVSADGDPICEMSGTSHEFEPAELLFHSFMSDEAGDFKSNLTMRGDGYSEHEFERGSLTLYEHEMTSGLTINEIADYPFREQWMKGGVEIFTPLENI
tara:strand:+ start:9739 stop:10410 length:672 start_codon:yes stop_codon:yes gene_type:complete